MGIFLEGEDSRGDHGLGRLVNLGLRPLLALHPPLSPHTHHRDNVTAPHGRPNLRSRLHSCHGQEGGPRSQQRICGGIGRRKKNEISTPYVSVPRTSNYLWIVDGVFLQGLFSSHYLSLYYDCLAKRIRWYEQ